MRAGIAVWVLALGCGGTERSAPPEGSLQLVNEDWRIVEMATAHGAFTIEVEAADGVDAAALARLLIRPLQASHDEVLIHFYARDSGAALPRLRVQWTAAGGYAETRYWQPVVKAPRRTETGVAPG